MLDSMLLDQPLPAQAQPHRVNCQHTIEPDQSVDLVDIDEPGCLRHIFFTMQPKRLRELILRIWWDGEDKPSVECPVSDFFGVGHDLTTSSLNTPWFYNSPFYGYNCYLPMPFASAARISVTNESDQQHVIISMVSYDTFEQPPDTSWRFHAAWRRAFPTYRRGENLTLLEAKGHGRLLGTIYHCVKRDADDRWTHGGGDQIFIDGETAKPAFIYGTGGEDFAHHAWGLYPQGGIFAGAHHVHPVPGIKRAEGQFAFEPHGFEQHDGGHYSMYRFFIPDAVKFKQSIRMTFGTVENEISSTTYWYQSEPHVSFTKLIDVPARAYGKRVTPEAGLQALAFTNDYPVAVLGPYLHGDTAKTSPPWRPDQPIDLAARYETNIKQPYGDVVRAPYEIYWRRSNFRGGFLDLAAIHRPKGLLRPRGLWNHRNLPVHTSTAICLSLKAIKACSMTLRLGFEDRLDVWLNTKQQATLDRPSPKHWSTQDVVLQLPAGSCNLVIEHTNDRPTRWSSWGLFVAFLNEQGKCIFDLPMDTFETLDPTPERYRDPWPPDGMVENDNWRDPAMLV